MKKINKIMLLLFLINNQIYNSIELEKKKPVTTTIYRQNRSKNPKNGQFYIKQEEQEVEEGKKIITETEKAEALEEISIEKAKEILGIAYSLLYRTKKRIRELELKNITDWIHKKTSQAKDYLKQGKDWTTKNATILKNHISDNKLKYAGGAMALATLGALGAGLKFNNLKKEIKDLKINQMHNLKITPYLEP